MEVDFFTYLQHTRLFMAGERDYSKLIGREGPIAYPALHLYYYTMVNWLSTNGANYLVANVIFSVQYLVGILFLFLILAKVRVTPFSLGITDLFSFARFRLLSLPMPWSRSVDELVV